MRSNYRSALPMAVVTILAAILTAAPPATATPNPPAAQVRDVVWVTDRQPIVTVFSPAMNSEVRVHLLLARDWYRNPQASFPVHYLLDGLRATDTENGWIAQTGVADFFADKNVTVVLPIGGQGSFYTDWLRRDNGKNYQWETFLTSELPRILQERWRASSVRSLAGLSMGGTAAMLLAARHPGFAKSAASYSGFLTTTTLGMPQAIHFALRDAGGFDSAAMWGPPGNPQWAAHDPYLLADKLRGTSLYVSSGSGARGPRDQAADIPGASQDPAGMGLEVLSRMTSENFVTKLRELHIPAQVNYRSQGTHSWPYWDVEMRQSWPQAATALGIAGQDPVCRVGGAVGALAAANPSLGQCFTPEYPVAGGIAQDFRGGRVFFSPKTGAQAVVGMISGGYQAAGGPAGAVGLPTGPERALPDGRGRWQPFERGVLYWTPTTGAQVVHGAIQTEWGRQGFERGPAGYPRGPEIATPKPGGAVQRFETGAFYFSPQTGAHRVGGMIAGKYAQMGLENSPLGFPTTEEFPVPGGVQQNFQGGNLVFRLGKVEQEQPRQPGS